MKTIICHPYLRATVDITPAWWSARLFDDGPDVLAALGASSLREMGVASVDLGPKQVTVEILVEKGLTNERISAARDELVSALDKLVSAKPHREETLALNRQAFTAGRPVPASRIRHLFGIPSEDESLHG